MHGGRLISFVVVAHALLTTACICYYTGATSHTLHKQALHYVLFPYEKCYWCWYVEVVVGAESFVSSLFCAAEFEFAPSPPHWSQQAFQTFLIDLRTLQSYNIQNTLLEPRRT
jgi:hypothetical protein